jgi:hypothetical protein
MVTQFCMPLPPAATYVNVARAFSAPAGAMIQLMLVEAAKLELLRISRYPCLQVSVEPPAQCVSCPHVAQVGESSTEHRGWPSTVSSVQLQWSTAASQYLSVGALYCVRYPESHVQSLSCVASAGEALLGGHVTMLPYSVADCVPSQ